VALRCVAAGRVSLSALGDHAGEAERLELEAHLAWCQRCTREHGTLLAVVGRLKIVEPAPLTPDARDGVRQALANRPPAARRIVQRSPWPWRVGIGLALTAAAATIGLLAFTARGHGYRVIEGDVAADPPLATPAGDQSVVLRSLNGGRVELADAMVDLVGMTEIAWNARRQRIDLRRGTVTIDVKHHAGPGWEIGTPRFTVEVVGSRFTVGASGVSTLRGVVRVIGPGGAISARVEAGETWSIDEPSTATGPRR
jgi:ferric-dicitrate binding protein FerR (iron transport regulator)